MTLTDAQRKLLVDGLGHWAAWCDERRRSANDIRELAALVEGAESVKIVGPTPRLPKDQS